MDQGGDTEPEDEGRAFAPTVHAHVLPTTPAQASRSGGPVRQTQSAITPGTKPLRRSIADVLRREMSSGAKFPQITNDTPAPTSGVTVLPTGSPSKLDHPGEQAVAGANPTALSTPDPTPAPHAGHKRTRECTNCGGTGRVPCSDVESDSSWVNDKVIKRPSAASPALARRTKRLSDGKRSDCRLAKLRADADKGKGKARATNEVIAESSTPLTHKYLIYAVAFVVFVDFTERFLGLRNVVVWLFHLV
ncbi:hypothetical protein FS749_015013 [Ceratobasidium sp. UAMH 11750]|nr:hypothetical protein FS749_015013 [Ceratobasidium sp. UAMH 11750]